MKIVFMGTPEFAVKILDELIKKYEVILVVTQPDNIRKKEYVYSPVKIKALENNIEVFQPEKIKQDYKKIIELDVDLIVTAAYGQIVGDEVLKHPKFGCINVHGSILPKYRGGAPIQRAIMNGEVETGVSIIEMVSKMDAGDIIKIEKIKIEEDDYQKTIFDKLSVLGSKLITKVIDNINTLPRTKQDESQVSYAPNITKNDELISFNNEAKVIYNQIRGLNPNPGAYFLLDGLIVKVYESVVSDLKHNTKPGVIVAINKDSFEISCCNNTVLKILKLQLPSKKIMKSIDFINGSGRKLLYIGKEI